MQDLSPTEIEAIVKSLGSSFVEPAPPNPENMPIEMATHRQLHHQEGSLSPAISKVQLAQLHEESSPSSPILKPTLENVNVDIEVVLGRTKIPIKKLLELQTGQVIDLDKFAGELVEVEANGKLIARGEVVVVNDFFGVKLTELL